MTDPLQHLVTSRSWEWLYELCRPLDLDVQLLDRTQATVSVAQTRPGGPAGSLSPEAIGRLRPAVEAAVASQSPQVARMGLLTIAISPLRVSGTVVGVLLLASREPGSGPGLATVSAWLRAAVERHLASRAVGAERLSALTRVLRPAMTDSSDRELIAMFAEALAVWHDIEVVGYFESAPGVFVRAVSLAGRSADDPALVFPPQAVPPPLALTRMPHTHVDGGTRADGADALVVTLSRNGTPAWLLTMSGAIDACEPALLSGYVSTLDLTIALATRAASARLALAVSADLTRGADRPGGLEPALDRVRRSLGAQAVEYTVTDEGGETTVTAGAHAHAQAPGPRPNAECPMPNAQGSSIRIRRRALSRSMTLEIEPGASEGWTPASHAKARAVADVLEGWVLRPEPRAVPASASGTLERQLEAHAAYALDRGDAVTVAVYSCLPLPTDDTAA
ncbi:MAG TPA: hypothetical protein VIY56_07700, partial [Vicinamibacterales bacterium]